MNAQELAPCPFCGFADCNLKYDGVFYFVQCGARNCSARTDGWAVEKDAPIAWNRRTVYKDVNTPSVAALEEKVAGLAAALKQLLTNSSVNEHQRLIITDALQSSLPILEKVRAEAMASAFEEASRETCAVPGRAVPPDLRLLIAMDMENMTEFKTYRFEKFALSARKILSKYDMAVNNLEFATEAHMTGMLIELRTWLLAGEHKADPVDIYTWATWWDHLKAEHFPMWAQNRWPPKKKKSVVVRPYSVWVCPHSDVKWPDSKHLSFLAQVDYGARYQEGPFPP